VLPEREDIFEQLLVWEADLIGDGQSSGLQRPVPRCEAARRCRVVVASDAPIFLLANGRLPEAGRDASQVIQQFGIRYGLTGDS